MRALVQPSIGITVARVKRFLIPVLAALVMTAASPSSDGRLSAVPQAALSRSLPAGKVLAIAGRARAYLPRSARAEEPKRLLVVMGGTGSDPVEVINMFRPVAEAAHVVLIAPSSRRPNFDAIENFFDDLEGGKKSAKVLWPAPRFGEDAAAIDVALKEIFSVTRIDPRYVAILGFSHGGSYALSLGTANPQLFGSIAALSPGVLIFQAERRGNQRVFLAHGRSDEVQPFQRTSRNFVNKLTELGYRVKFQPYNGGHSTPGNITDAALRDLFGSR